MMEYTIEQAINIINKCDESYIHNSNHFIKRNVQRVDDLFLIFKTFLNNQIMGILKQDFNKFRVYFEHETKATKDLSSVIVILSNEDIKFITVMETVKNKRVK